MLVQGTNGNSLIADTSVYYIYFMQFYVYTFFPINTDKITYKRKSTYENTMISVYFGEWRFVIGRVKKKYIYT